MYMCVFLCSVFAVLLCCLPNDACVLASLSVRGSEKYVNDINIGLTRNKSWSEFESGAQDGTQLKDIFT